MNINNVYPITIISDRYTGAYSGGKFLAFKLYANQIPNEVSLNDMACAEFWDTNTDLIIGKGDTPNKALKDLIKKLNAN